MKLLLGIGLLRLFFSALARAAVRADAGFLLNIAATLFKFIIVLYTVS